MSAIPSFSIFDKKNLRERQELLRNAFSENIGTPFETNEHYHWKFQQSPAYPNAFEYEARMGDKMVGYYGAISFPYSIAGEIFRFGMVCDVMTHSQARGKGVFSNLGAFALKDLSKNNIDVTSGYPIRPEVIPGHLKVGWKIAFELPMYFRFLRSNSILESKGLGWLAPFANLFLKLVNGLFNLITPAPLPTIQVREMNLETLVAHPQFANIIRIWQTKTPNYLIKTPDFYRWRFRAPATQYQFIVAEQMGVWIGLAVVRRVVLQGVPCMAILDWMVSSEARAPLFQKIRELAELSACDAITTMMSRWNAHTHQFFRFGLLPSPMKFKLILNPLSARAKQSRLFDAKLWHLMWVDCDDL